jgi:hypothetical protein
VTITLKRNDTRVNLKAVLSNESGPVNLTDCSVRFIMSKRGFIKIDRQAEIREANNGQVWFIFEKGDTDEVGAYHAEFEVTFPDSRVETFPNSGFILINIQNDLG